MKNKNILFICEGEDEERLLEIVLNTYKIHANFKIYKYKTNIHIFAKHLFDYYFNDIKDINIEDIDIIQILKEFRFETILNIKYTDILFVFDYDPHDPRFKPEVLEKLMYIFHDSTNQGQLYINYPMVEAVIDFRTLPDLDYNKKTCNLKDLRFNGYKNRVKKSSIIKDISSINEEILCIIVRQTYEKVKYIMNDESMDYLQLLRIQNKMMGEEKIIYIVGTCLLFTRDYNQMFFNNFIKNK